MTEEYSPPLAEPIMNQRLFGAAGFSVLDIVEPSRNQPPVHFHFGGTAGNVTAILASWGWKSYPFARLQQEGVSFAVLDEDLARLGVQPDFVSLAPSAPLPVLVQRKRVDGSKEPVFTSRCPRCNFRWRGWSSITEQTAKETVERMPCFDAFLLDRYTAGNLTLATRARANGAMIFFEPASLNLGKPADVKRFKKALELTDVLKYSAQQLPDLPDTDFPRQHLAEVQTRGEDGVRFRRVLPDRSMSDWENLPAFPVSNVQDPCGAGDWLTAIMIHLMGIDAVDRQGVGWLREVLTVGQAASAWACQFPGARGGMYGSPTNLEDYVAERVGKRYPLVLRSGEGHLLSRDITLNDAMVEFCPECRGDWMKTKEIAPTPRQFGQWRAGGRPGYVGRKAASKQADLNRRHGPGNWRIRYKWKDATITRDEALRHYTGAYVEHLKRNPDVLEWLVTTACDVYDIEPKDVQSGFDFSIQKGAATHLQDIAVRIAVDRLGRNFQGNQLVQIRSKNSKGAVLNPGVVPFHDPDAITKPELKGWWRAGTIESFWQSNKIMEICRWKSRVFVFGGSFNPIHNGHLALARFARDTLGFDRIIFVPNGDNYRKITLAGTPAVVRLEMIQAAIENECGMAVLDAEVRDMTPMRTPITMRELSEQYPDSQLALYRGLDSLHRTHRDCFALPNVIVLALDRKGVMLSYEQVLARHRKFEHVRDRIVYMGEAFADDHSSTKVREAVANGQPIEGMVSAAVEKVIRERGLYCEKTGRN